MTRSNPSGSHRTPPLTAPCVSSLTSVSESRPADASLLEEAASLAASFSAIRAASRAADQYGYGCVDWFMYASDDAALETLAPLAD